MLNGLESKVLRPNKDLVICDYKNCKDRGEYVRCYFDIHKSCVMYISHNNYLKTVKEMKRHHKKMF